MKESKDPVKYEEIELTEYKEVLLSHLSRDQNISTQKPDGLRFSDVEVVSYFMFLKESSQFILNYLFSIIPAVLFYSFFRMIGHEKMIGVITFPLLTMDLFSSGFRDFQEAIGIICGPFISKKDYYHYRINRNRLIFLNCLLYGIFMFIPLFFVPMYKLLGIKGDLIDVIIDFSYFYVYLYGPLMTISNFLKGNLL